MRLYLLRSAASGGKYRRWITAIINAVAHPKMIHPLTASKVANDATRGQERCRRIRPS